MELNEITPYLAHGLNVWINEDIDCSSNGDNPQYDEIAGFIKKGKYKLVAIGTDGNSMFCSDVALLDENHTEAMTELKYIKLILHPLSDLVKPCLGGDKIPIVELAKIAYPKHSGFKLNKLGRVDMGLYYSFGYSEKDKGFDCKRGFDSKKWDYDCFVPNQLALFQWMFEHHFDVLGLIEKGQAIDINTLTGN